MEVSRAAFDELVVTNPAAVYALVQDLAQQVATLTAQNAAVTTQVQELAAQLGQHSPTRSGGCPGHRPPSSDGPQVVAPRSQRQRSGKHPGGQAGHPGHTLPMSAAPAVVVGHHPVQCGHCGADLRGVAPTTVERRQVVDLPPLALVVTEHQAATVCCPHCAQAPTAPFPAALAPGVQYGPQVLGLGRYLRH